MVIISYDISNDKKRRIFSKFLGKFGHRIQYSVFEIDNAQSVLNNIILEINNKYKKMFDQSDSVYIFNLSKNCKIFRYGYAENDEKSILFV